MAYKPQEVVVTQEFLVTDICDKFLVPVYTKQTSAKDNL